MRLRLIISIGMLLVVAGCGGGDDPTQTAASASAGAAVETGLSSEPFGEYEREVTEEEIRTTPGQEAPPPGTWHLTLGQTIIQVVDAGGFRFAQELAVSGETLEIERYLGGDGVFCENDAPSSYTWKLNEDRLTLAAIEDACPDRRLILEAEWKRIG